MGIENQLKNLILERFGTQSNFADAIGMPKSTLNTIFKRGIRKASITTILDICEALEISADELANDRIVPITPVEDPDIETLIRSLRLSAAYTLDGKKMTEDELACLFESIYTSLNCIRRLR